MAGLLVREPKPIAACCSQDLKDNRELIMQSRCGVCHQDKCLIIQGPWQQMPSMFLGMFEMRAIIMFAALPQGDGEFPVKQLG